MSCSGTQDTSQTTLANLLMDSSLAQTLPGGTDPALPNSLLTKNGVGTVRPRRVSDPVRYDVPVEVVNIDRF